MKINSKGLFITLEGGEGSGKTTLLHQLTAYFQKNGRDVLATREPGGTFLGETIRSLLLSNSSHSKIGLQAELLLFLAARSQHLEEKIVPALNQAKIVICDRFNDSTIAYQGGARGLGVEYVESLCKQICGKNLPQITFYLSLPPEVGLARSRGINKEHAAKGELDRIESESLDFHRKIHQTLEDLAKKEPGRICKIDARQPQEEVFKKVISVIENL